MPRTRNDLWAAIEAAGDPLRHALRLSRLNETARSGRSVGHAVRPVVDRSWQRSAAAGVDPSVDRPFRPLDEDALEARRAAHPLLPVRGTLSRLLGDLSDSAPYVFALSDAHGTLLWVDGQDAAVERARDEIAFEVGADWSERAAGTNAVGTALAENHPVQIFSAEHFRPAVHSWTCSGAPICDPETGDVIGVLDATADLRTVDPATLPYLVAAARAAEEVLRARVRRRDAQLLQRVHQRPAGAPRPELALSPAGRVLPLTGGATPAPLGPADRRWRLPVPGPEGGTIRLPDGRLGHAEPAGTDGFLVYADRRTATTAPSVTLELLGTVSPQARTPAGSRPISRGHADILALLAVHPEGLRAEQLAVLLHGDDAHAGTARAACSRLRSALPGVVLTRPYRLARGVAGDMQVVRIRLAEGDLAGAVGAYRGPLLPDSVAPGVREIADSLHAELRGALLEAGDVGALGAWCATPHGSDDLRAAEALMAALPPGDPRRGAASGRIRTLRRRYGLTDSGAAPVASSEPN